MQEALDDLVKLLDLEAIEVNIFRGTSFKFSFVKYQMCMKP